jgi:cytochrome c-type biogenesis protein CcmH/NrfG
MNSTKLLLSAFGAALLLTLALYFLPTHEPDAKKPEQTAAEASPMASGSVAFLLNTADSIRDLLSGQQDAAARESMGKTAIAVYNQVLQQDPSNLDAKAGMGFCLAEASPQPMSGIMMLREVVKTDPNHENGQLFLGLLSLQSGQLDKAIDRFEKVIVLDSENNNVLLLLGRTYAETGNRKKALEIFMRLKEKSTEPSIKQEAESWIAKLQSAS